MVGKNEDVHKDTWEIMREIVQKYNYDVVLEKSQESVQKSVLEVLGIQSIGNELKIVKLDE